MALSPLKRKSIPMVEVAFGEVNVSTNAASSAEPSKPQPSAAEAWARKRAAAIAKAAELRARRLENQLGMGDVDFLDRLCMAEKRDEQKATSGPAPPAPSKKAAMPKVLTKPHTKPKEDGSSSSLPSARQQRRAAAAAAKLEAERAVHERRPSTKASACDPGRELAQHGYEPLGPIAAGAFSTILRARELATGVEVAVKTFDNAKCGRAKPLADARDAELSALRALAAHANGAAGRHAHVAHLLAEHAGPNATHAVLEYCEGGSLQRHLQLLQKTRAATRGVSAGCAAGSSSDAVGMSEAPAAQVLWQVACALEYLHALEMAHRDVKPGNILFVGANGPHEPWMRVKLCDFGFALKCGHRRLKKQVGTPQYVAPELTLPPDAHAGYRGKPVDMWALGAVAYETLHGKHAFHGASFEQLETRIRANSHEPLLPTLSAAARALIHALLVADPDKRLTAKAAAATTWLKHGRRDNESAARAVRQRAAADGVDAAASGRDRDGDGAPTVDIS